MERSERGCCCRCCQCFASPWVPETGFSRPRGGWW
jgi:hypothetical protein